MPKNTNILLIRHGEKPPNGVDLAVPGQQRAQAYAIYFQNYVLQSSSKSSGKESSPLQLNYLMAAADSSNSDRPDLTLVPLSAAIWLPIDASYSDKDYQKAADDILKKSEYDNSNVLICWHHGEILELAAALGVDPTKLPPSANWPGKWPGGEYGWVLQICFDGSGKIRDKHTLCINEKLMYDDQNDPPGPAS